MANYSEYLKIFISHMDKFRVLEKKRDEITAEMRRVHQMAKASLAMMPEAERRVMAERLGKWELPGEGLTEAIRNVLLMRFDMGKRGNDLWMNPVQIKDALDVAGYDFSSYKSNPLVSVHAVLKRLDRKEVNSRHTLDGSKEYRISKKELTKKFLRDVHEANRKDAEREEG